jgi:hypothetical protein
MEVIGAKRRSVGRISGRLANVERVAKPTPDFRERVWGAPKIGEVWMLPSPATRRIPRALLLVLVIAQMVVPASAFAQVSSGDPVGPSIASDKDDYAPAELVTLTGSGWQPSESVHIWVNDDQGRTWERNSNVTADENGNITDSFNLPDWFVATYEVIATGELSGIARTNFTDGNVQAQTNGPTVTLQFREFTSNNCSTGGQTPGQATISPSTGSTILFGRSSGSFSLSVPAITGAQEFSQWTSQAGFSSQNNPLCFTAISGNRTFTANYAASPIAPTSLNAGSANGIYGGTVNLSATLSAGASSVGGKTVDFTLNGMSVGSATTNGSGVASLNGVSLDGIDAGTYATGVSASFAGDGSHGASSASNVLDVTQKQVTGNFTAKSKVYDGNADAEIDSRSLSGTVEDDEVSLTGGSAAFDNKNVGEDKPVSLTGASLAGADKDNYTLGSVSDTTADITPRDLTVSATGVNRLYDGTTHATVSLTTDKLDGDQVVAGHTGASFADRNAGNGKAVTISGISISGDDAGNYKLLNTTTNTTANITPLPIIGSFASADKVWDGNTAATVTTRLVSGAIAGDDVGLSGGTATFDNPNVGNDKTVTLTGATLAGADKDNYALASVSTATADILAWSAQGHGFYQPIGVANSVFVAAPSGLPAATSSTTYNTAKGGSTIPLKFNLYAGGVEKTSTSDISGFIAVKLSGCSAGVESDPVDFVTTGNTNLRYDSTGGHFIQNWKTPSANSDTCYRATVKFADGSSLSAFFRLRK